MDNFLFKNSTELLFGEGQVEKVGEKTKEYGSKVLVTSGGGSVKRIGLYDRVLSSLRDAGMEIYKLAGITPNPRASSVEEGVKICQENDIDIVLAVGGGSTIDASKAIALAAYQQGDIWEFLMSRNKPEKVLPLGSILTLAATGTESNGNFVISNPDEELKIGFYSRAVYPNFSILDPENTYTVPENHTVYGIVDMASHVFEQYFSHTPNTPLQDRWAEGVIKTLIEESRKVIEDPEDYDVRANIMLCGTLAFNDLIAVGKRGDWASHAMEHELSAIYDIPHGGGLAIVQPNWMEYVCEEGLDKFVQYAVKVFGVNTAGKSDKEVAMEGIQRTREWFDELGAPSRLADYNIFEENLEIMAEKATKDGSIGAYKKLGQEDVLKILKMSL